MVHSDAFKQRDVTARAFSDQYQSQAAEFPPECRGSDYEKRIAAAFPAATRVRGDRFASVAQGLGIHAQTVFGAM